MNNQGAIFSEGFCPVCREDIELSPFADQHCHDCEKAIWLFNSKKRQMMKMRQDKASRNGSLTAEELEAVKSAMPEGIKHLDICPANQF